MLFLKLIKNYGNCNKLLYFLGILFGHSHKVSAPYTDKADRERGGELRPSMMKYEEKILL